MCVVIAVAHLVYLSWLGCELLFRRTWLVKDVARVDPMVPFCAEALDCIGGVDAMEGADDTVIAGKDGESQGVITCEVPWES